MPGQTLLDYLPLWAVFAAVCGASSLALEVGFRFGRRVVRRCPDEANAPVGEIVGALLTLSGFLLALTFSIAVTFFSARRDAILDEANAIGTTWLRADLLPEPNRSAVRRFLREYVDVRLEAIQNGRVDEAIARSEALQQQLWNEAIATSKKQPDSFAILLFIPSLNQVIDLHTKRVTAGLYSRIPAFVWLTLYFITALTMAGIGYHSAFARRRSISAGLALVLAFSAVLLLVADLDRPHGGALRANQQPLIDLQKTLKRIEP